MAFNIVFLLFLFAFASLGNGETRALYVCPQSPPGFYCRPGDKSPRPCGIGHFCPLENLSERTKCPLGHYCPNSTMTSPPECPTGSYCPRDGLSLPLKCPVGFSCHGSGLTTPSLCPVGHHCPRIGLSDPPPCPLWAHRQCHECLGGIGHLLPQFAFLILPCPLARWMSRHNELSQFIFYSLSVLLFIVVFVALHHFLELLLDRKIGLKTVFMSCFRCLFVVFDPETKADRRRLRELQMCIEARRTRMEELIASRDEMKVDTKNLQGEISFLDGQIREREDLIESLQERTEFQQSELHSLRGEIVAERASTERTTLKETVGRLTQRRDAFQKLWTEAMSELQSLEKQQVDNDIEVADGIMTRIPSMWSETNVSNMTLETTAGKLRRAHFIEFVLGQLKEENRKLKDEIRPLRKAFEDLDLTTRNALLDERNAQSDLIESGQRSREALSVAKESLQRVRKTHEEMAREWRKKSHQWTQEKKRLQSRQERVIGRMQKSNVELERSHRLLEQADEVEDQMTRSYKKRIATLLSSVRRLRKELRHSERLQGDFEEQGEELEQSILETRKSFQQALQAKDRPIQELEETRDRLAEKLRIARDISSESIGVDQNSAVAERHWYNEAHRIHEKVNVAGAEQRRIETKCRNLKDRIKRRRQQIRSMLETKKGLEAQLATLPKSSAVIQRKKRTLEQREQQVEATNQQEGDLRDAMARLQRMMEEKKVQNHMELLELRSGFLEQEHILAEKLKDVQHDLREEKKKRLRQRPDSVMENDRSSFRRKTSRM